MNSFKNRVDKVAAKKPSAWLEKAEWRVENELWLDKSTKIALKILTTLRKQGIDKNQLSISSGISMQQMDNILKGEENLTLELISRIEKSLGITL